MKLLASVRQRLAGFIAPPVNPFAVGGLRSEVSGPPSPVQAAGNSLATALPAGMARIIRPESAARWGILPQLGSITPQYIEQTLRGAMAGAHVQQWELFDLMKDTWPRLLKNDLELKRGAVSLLTSKFELEAFAEEGEAPTPEALERHALVKRAIRQMKPRAGWDENGWDATLHDLAGAWTVGTTVLELLDWQTIGADVLPRATYWVHPTNYAWAQEGFLGLANATSNAQRSTSNSQRGVTPFPDHKFLVAICKAKEGHPLSGALLRPLAWWWCAANFSADWLLNFAQVFGMPIRWAHYPTGTPQATIDAICAMLQNMGSNAWAAFPEGAVVDLKESSKGGAGTLPQESILDRADKQCDLLLLGQTLTSDTGGGGKGGGSLALGEVHKGVRSGNILSVASFVATVLNDQLIPSILTLNYGDTEHAPRFCAPQEEEDTNAIIEGYGVAVRAGAITPNVEDEKHFRSKLGLPQMSKDVVREWAKQGGARSPVTIQNETAIAPTAPNFGALKEVQAANAASLCARCGKPVAHCYPWRTNTRQPLHEECADIVLFGKPAQAANAGSAVSGLPSDVSAFAAAVADDLRFALDRLARIAEITDPALFEAKLREFARDFPQLKADVLADPASARALLPALVKGLEHGLASQPKA